MGLKEFCGPECCCTGLSLESRCQSVCRAIRPEDLDPYMAPIYGNPAEFDPLPNATGFVAWLLEQGHLEWRADPEGCDRWCRPRETLRLGYGDCDDHAILLASAAIRVGAEEVAVIAGCVENEDHVCQGHAWVECVHRGRFYFAEATSAEWLPYRPAAYKRHHILSPTGCVYAPEYLAVLIARARCERAQKEAALAALARVRRPSPVVLQRLGPNHQLAELYRLAGLSR